MNGKIKIEEIRDPRSIEGIGDWIDFEHGVTGLAKSIFDSLELTERQIALLFRAALRENLNEEETNLINDNGLNNLFPEITELVGTQDYPGFSDSDFRTYIVNTLLEDALSEL